MVRELIAIKGFIRLIPLTVVLLCLIKNGAAQVLVSEAPPAVVTEARRVAGLMNVTLPANPPNEIWRQPAQHTGHQQYRLTWSQANVEITVDGMTLKVVEYDNQEVAKIAYRKGRQSELPSITQAQATLLFNQLLQTLSLTSAGDWRNQVTEKVTYSTNSYSWLASTRLFYQNRSVNLGRFVAFIEPYTGKVKSWSYQNVATFASPSGSLLTKAQAQPFAEQAFLQYAGPSLVPSDSRTPVGGGSGTWEPLNDNTTISRVTYRFVFRLPEISDPNNTDIPVRFQQEIWVDVDGETGELIFLGNVLASGTLKKTGPVDFSPRYTLLYQMLHAKASHNLLRAVAGGKFNGKSVDAKRISRVKKEAIPVKIMLTKNPEIPPAPAVLWLDVKSRHLYWQEDGKNWYGVLLSGNHLRYILSSSAH